MTINNLIITTPSVIDINKTKKIGSCYLVDKDQPESVCRAVEKLSHYFKREFHYDYNQYTAYEDKESKLVRAYIWIDSDWEDTFAVGACGFRFLGDVNQIKNWSFQWGWFHPYYRNRGLLSAAWPSFVKKFGKDFHVEPPISKAMEDFLKKMNHGVSK